MLSLPHKTLTSMVHDLKVSRFKLLNALYQWSQGDTRRWVDLKELCQLRHLPWDERAYHYLVAEGLAACYGAGYACYITHAGIKAIEQAYDRPQAESTYFPALSSMQPEGGVL